MGEFSKLENTKEEPEAEGLGESLESQEGPSKEGVSSKDGLEGLPKEVREELRVSAENIVDSTKEELNEERAGLGIPESDEVPPSVQDQAETLRSLDEIDQKGQEGGGVADEERGPETIPTSEDVRLQFEQLAEGAEYTERRMLEDELPLFHLVGFCHQAESHYQIR